MNHIGIHNGLVVGEKLLRMFIERSGPLQPQLSGIVEGRGKSLQMMAQAKVVNTGKRNDLDAIWGIEMFNVMDLNRISVEVPLLIFVREITE